MKLRHSLNLLLVIFLFLFTINAFSESSPIKDAVITTKIKSKIAMDKSLSAFKVGVTTNSGIVTLTGNVDSDSEASSAIEIAQSTDGVKDVEASQLIIKKSQSPLADIATTAKIKGMFIKEKLFGEKDIAATTIRVETNNGVVYLTGTADSSKQAENAVSIAKSVNGVKNVESRVKIK